MDKQVIEKVIKLDGGSCPDFKYENPLLDRSVAKSLSRGFLNILKDPNLTEHQRSLVLENIRKSCKVGPPEHLPIDDNVTELLRVAYEEHLSDYNIDKELDSFLIRNFKEMNINSVHMTSIKLDIVQALLNLNGKQLEKYDALLKNIIYWNIDENNQKSYIDILKPMWNKDFISRLESDDISIKMKPFIEELLLTCASEMLGSVIIIDEEEWFSENKDLIKLVEICSVSNECFQICCFIMNSLFISTNFDKQLLKFIELFIDSIKNTRSTISQLYPPNLQYIVLLLDMELKNLDGQIKEIYIESTLKQLGELDNCENNLIMLLSHFKKWFDLYYDYKQETDN